MTALTGTVTWGIESAFPLDVEFLAKTGVALQDIVLEPGVSTRTEVLRAEHGWLHIE